MSEGPWKFREKPVVIDLPSAEHVAERRQLLERVIREARR